MSKEEEHKTARDESSSQRDWQHHNSLYNKEVRRREESQKQQQDAAERQANLRYNRAPSSLGGSSSSGSGCVGALFDIIFPDDTFVKLFREIFRPVPLLVLLAELFLFPLLNLVPLENLALAGTIFIFSKSARSISGRLLLVIGIPIGGLFLLNVIVATRTAYQPHGADALIEQQLSSCLRGKNGASASGQTGCYETGTRKWNDRLLNDQARVKRDFSRQPSIVKGFTESVKAMQSSTEQLVATATKEAAPGDKKLIAARTKYGLIQSRVTKLESYLKKGVVPGWNASDKN